jgi:beta-phosphoglucomutase family hydrolase
MGTRRTRLAAEIKSCLFDLDGVLVNSVPTHSTAWKETFDAFLEKQAEHDGTPFVPFDIETDYVRYVDGMKREDGVRTFLRSRGIEVPDGHPDDGPDAMTVYGIGNRKNARVHEIIDAQGVDVYSGSIALVHAVRADGLSTAVVSSSVNAPWILRSASIDNLFDACIDGGAAARNHIRGKPAPDMFLAAAVAVQVEPEHAAVFEDALAGVQAGRAGRFGLVVGVDRRGEADALRSHGADVVVEDLAELLGDGGHA